MKIGLTSNQQTFIDLTDTRVLSVNIACNLPTTQIRDTSNNAYTPDWSATPLTLVPQVYLGSAELQLGTTGLSVQWQRQEGTDNPSNLATDEGELVSDGVVTVSQNILSTSASGFITYICTATYNDMEAVARVSFNLTSQGQVKAGITYQLYAPDGYLLSQDLESLTLETFAYEGNTQITTGAEYAWSKQENGEWIVIEGQTDKKLVITKDEVLKSKSYKCDMTYRGITYSATATVQDRSDIYNSVLCISSNTQSASGENYWVLYSLVYSEESEVDPLLGPISITAPDTALKDDYWYAIDETNLTVTLKKFNGTAWEDTVDTQQFNYYWSMSNNSGDGIPVGEHAKVNIISSHDFTSTITLMCEVSNQTDGVLTRSTLSLTDVSDPIVSETEPTNVSHGQIWIKKNADGTFLMFVWDAVEEAWGVSDADSRNRVYTSRPSSYSAGDLWITASDEDHGTYLQGTLLQAQADNTAYNADDWSPTLKYDQDIDDMKEQLDNLAQYVTINSDGLRIGARTESGELSPFTSLFTSTELSFYQNSDRLLTLANNKLTAPSIETDDIQINNMITLGNLRLTIEDNGSFSFTVFS